MRHSGLCFESNVVKAFEKEIDVVKHSGSCMFRVYGESILEKEIDVTFCVLRI